MPPEPADQTRPTLVARLLQHPASVAVMDAAPVPLALARVWLGHDNAREVARDDWARLADPSEQPRYAAVRDAVARHAPHGSACSVLDVGCSRGLLLDGLACGRYVGVDASPGAVAVAEQERGDAHATFAVADAVTYVPPEPLDAIVVNEVVYYLPRPRQVLRRYAASLAPEGVLVVSIFARAWASRRLLRRLAQDLEQVESRTVGSGHLAWTVAVYRRAPDLPGEPSPQGYRH